MWSRFAVKRRRCSTAISDERALRVLHLLKEIYCGGHRVKGRAALVALIAALLRGAAAADDASPYAPLSMPLKIERVPDRSVYYSIGNPGIPGYSNEGNTSNAGFVVTPEGVVVFDALGTPSLGWALLQEITEADRQGRFATSSPAITTPTTFTGCRRSRIKAAQ